MYSIVGYGSDEDSNDSQERRRMGGRPGNDSSRNYRKPTPHEDNYEEVGMDMSNEDSDESGNEKMEDAFPTDSRSPARGSFRSSPPSTQKPRMSLEDSSSSRGSRDDRSDTRASRKDDRDSNRKQQEETWATRNERKKEYNGSPRDRGDSSSARSDRNPPERRDRSVDKPSESDRYRSREDKRSDKARDNRHGDHRDRSYTRGRDDRDDRGRDRDDKDRERDTRRDKRDDNRRDRDRRRSRTRSRERKRSRSPRRSSRSPPYRRGGPPFSKREKAAARMDRLDKLGIELNSSNSPQDFSGPESGKVPPGGLLPAGVTGKFREQIEKRKMLWQRAKEGDSNTGNKTPAVSTAQQPVMSVAGGSSKATKVYEATTFADDKQSSKFKRLMGIKDTSLPVAIKNPEVLKKQEEMFSTMEAQYEVARTTTHTMRGVGLGFGSLQR